MIRSEIENWFTYHKPLGNQPETYELLRKAAKEYALLLHEKCPDCLEKDEAIKKVRESIMWLNAGIACNELDRVGNEPILKPQYPNKKESNNFTTAPHLTCAMKEGNYCKSNNFEGLRCVHRKKPHNCSLGE